MGIIVWEQFYTFKTYPLTRCPLSEQFDLDSQQFKVRMMEDIMRQQL